MKQWARDLVADRRAGAGACDACDVICEALGMDDVGASKRRDVWAERIVTVANAGDEFRRLVRGPRLRMVK